MAVFSFLTITAALAVNISRFVKALGEQRRHDTDGIRLEITAPGCRSSARRSTAELPCTVPDGDYPFNLGNLLALRLGALGRLLVPPPALGGLDAWREDNRRGTRLLVGWAVQPVSYYRSPEYRDLAPISQRNRRSIIERSRQQTGRPARAWPIINVKK